jgi:glycine oxidase
MHEVLIIGGGVIGLTIAYESAGRGLKVVVLEQGQFGREASWAGAGIIPPGGTASGALDQFAAAASQMWPDLSAELRELTGIDNGYRRCGGICFAATPGGDVPADIAAWRAAGAAIEPLSPAAVHGYEPRIANEWAAAAYRLPEMAQVRNPRHLKALIAACQARGVELQAGQPVTEIECAGGKVTSVRTPTGRFTARQYVVAGGAWSRQVLATCGHEIDIEPVRGQIVLLSMLPLPFRHVLECGLRYLVPRPDGRILVGSTEEWVGFDKSNTAEALRELLDFAIGVVPVLREASYEQAWSGLRPYARRGQPYIGRVPDCENLLVAAGHFRGGLTLSPITGRLVAQTLVGERPELPLDAYTVAGGPA